MTLAMGALLGTALEPAENSRRRTTSLPGAFNEQVLPEQFHPPQQNGPLARPIAHMS